jgi:hypothetical protein
MTRGIRYYLRCWGSEVDPGSRKEVEMVQVEMVEKGQDGIYIWENVGGIEGRDKYEVHATVADSGKTYYRIVGPKQVYYLSNASRDDLFFVVMAGKKFGSLGRPIRCAGFNVFQVIEGGLKGIQ